VPRRGIGSSICGSCFSFHRGSIDVIERDSPTDAKQNTTPAQRRRQVIGDQLEFDLDWGKEPWQGRSPRSLSKGACVVDNSVVGCPSREAQRFGPFPAQFTLFVSGVPEKES